eukprot:SAG22_NODE_6425_length_857_cov_1.055409_2_plen_75_part_01
MAFVQKNGLDEKVVDALAGHITSHMEAIPRGGSSSKGRGSHNRRTGSDGGGRRVKNEVRGSLCLSRSLPLLLLLL